MNANEPTSDPNRDREEAVAPNGYRIATDIHRPSA